MHYTVIPMGTSKVNSSQFIEWSKLIATSNYRKIKQYPSTWWLYVGKEIVQWKRTRLTRTSHQGLRGRVGQSGEQWPCCSRHQRASQRSPAHPTHDASSSSSVAEHRPLLCPRNPVFLSHKITHKQTYAQHTTSGKHITFVPRNVTYSMLMTIFHLLIILCVPLIWLMILIRCIFWLMAVTLQIILLSLFQ